jgi:uncharacterized protein with HEPN domain
MSKRSDRFLVEDIIEHIDLIFLYTHNLDFDTFKSDSKTFNAVARCFTVIGEAGSRLSVQFSTNFPTVEIYKIIGFRNRIVHEYFGIDYEIVWNIIQQYLLTLKKELDEVLLKLD